MRDRHRESGVSRKLSQIRTPPGAAPPILVPAAPVACPEPKKAPATISPAEQFNERLYLRLNPDVRMAVVSGAFHSGWHHYHRFGRAEGRPTTAPANVIRDRVIFVMDPDKIPQPVHVPAFCIEHVQLTPSGGVHILGWVNDSRDPLASIELHFSSLLISFRGADLARSRRTDAEAALKLLSPHDCGFWGFKYITQNLTADTVRAVVQMKSGGSVAVTVTVEKVEDDDLRRNMLCQLAQANYRTDPYFAAVQSIDASIATQLVNFNQILTRRAVKAPSIVRFGRDIASYKGSII